MKQSDSIRSPRLVWTFDFYALEHRAHPPRRRLPVDGSTRPLASPRRCARIPDAELEATRVGGIVERAVHLRLP